MRKGFKVLIIAYILILGIGAIYGMATLNQKLQSLDATDLSPLRLAYAVFVFCTFIPSLIYQFKTFNRPTGPAQIESDVIDLEFTQNEPQKQKKTVSPFFWVINIALMLLSLGGGIGTLIKYLTTMKPEVISLFLPYLSINLLGIIISLFGVIDAVIWGKHIFKRRNLETT